MQGTVNVTVDWGDGKNETVTSAGNLDHTYASEGIKNVTISGSLVQFGAWDYPNADKLVAVLDFGNLGITSLITAFHNATNLTFVPSSLPETVTNMRYMFYKATSFNGDISTWDVSSVTNMTGMFSRASSFTGNISAWDVSSVTNMRYMFSGASSFNGDISAWDVSSVTDMGSMFDGAGLFTSDISAWKVRSVTDMSSMFYGASSFKGDISAWDVSSVTNMGAMFSGASAFTGDISAWKVRSVTDMSSMFYGASSFKGDISAWNVSSVTNMRRMFMGATVFNQDISAWKVGSVTNMEGLFWRASSFNGNINAWDVSSVTNMESMFFGAGSFTSDISTWDVSSVTNMTGMFSRASSFTSDISTWDVSSVIGMEQMFDGASSFNGDISKWNVGSVTNMYYMFSGASSFTSDISAWDVGSVTNMGFMFYKASSFTGDISKWDVGFVTNMSFMFYKASSFTGDISAWKVGSVTNMREMFSGASSFNGDISAWDVSSVTSMMNMFSGASSFNSDISAWNVSSVTNMESMFYGVRLLTATYDTMLEKWSKLTLKPNVKFHGGDSRYTDQASRDILTNAPNNWIIIDGGAMLTQTITFSNIAATYGDIDFELKAKATSNLPISYTSSNTKVATITNENKIHILKAGTCNILANQEGNDDYLPAEQVSVTLTISPKAITATANAKTKTYGDADPALTYTSDKLVGDDTFTGLLSRKSGEDVADYAISQNTLTAGDNYTIAFTGATFNISPKAITVTANTKTKTYGDADPALTYTATLVGDDTFSGELARESGENVGNYAISQNTLTAGTNYNITFIGETFTISPKAIKLTVDANQTKVYGDDDPTLNYTADKLVGDDTFSGLLSRETGENVADYAILQNTLTAGGNYTIAFTGADFTISPKAITVTADANQTKTYGDTESTLTYTADELVGDDTFTGLLSRKSGENVADYAISQNTLTAGDNYTIAFTGAMFTISPKAITVTANTKTKTYGDADPALTYTSDKLVGDDTFSGELARETGEAISSYNITMGSLSAGDNYTIAFTGATFTIKAVNKAPLFTSEPIIIGVEAVEYIYIAQCMDIDKDALSLVAIEKPEWLSLLDNGDGTCTLSGTPAVGGSYHVILEVSDSEFTVQQKFDIEVEVVTGIEPDLTTSTVNIYPNPVANELHIDLSNFKGQELSIALYSLTGKLIFKEAHQNIGKEVRMSKSLQYLRSGMYLLVLDTDGIRKTYKIVKK